MSEDAIRLLVLAFIFFVLPLLEGILRGRKKQQGEVPPPEANDPIFDEWDRVGDRGLPRTTAEAPPEPAQPGAGPPQPARSRSASAEDMLPADLWEELRALARGKPPKRSPPNEPFDEVPAASTGSAPTTDRDSVRPASHERPSGEGEAELRSRPQRRPLPSRPVPRPVSRRAEPTAPVARPGRQGLAARAAPAPMPGLQGMPAAPRSPLEEGFLEPSESSGRHRVLTELKGMGASEMRRAIIFREVLGPPVAWRDRDPFDSL